MAVAYKWVEVGVEVSRSGNRGDLSIRGPTALLGRDGGEEKRGCAQGGKESELLGIEKSSLDGRSGGGGKRPWHRERALVTHVGVEQAIRPGEIVFSE